jgi:hypothetical protein
MHSQRKKLLAAALTALAVTGAGAAIAQSSTGKSASTATSRTPPPGPMGGGPDGGPVHSVSVEPNRAGTGFVTETVDRGTVESVDAAAGTITIAEGTKTLTYAKPTLKIASGATIVLDGRSSSLSNLATGDRVTVSSSSDGTAVFAADSSFQPRRDGPGHPGGPGGPPPGAF